MAKRLGKLGVFMFVLAGALWMLGHVAQAIELRVFPNVATDLQFCTDGTGPLAFGPSAGQTAVAGDTCILETGTFNPGGVVLVTLANLDITSKSGRTTTTVRNGFDIQVAGVTIESISITGSIADGVRISANADEDITIQDNFINGNAGAGINVVTPSQVEDLRFSGNNLRGNGGAGIAFANTVTRTRDITIIGNTVDSNSGGGVLFMNNGILDGVSILGNTILRSSGHGVSIDAPVSNVGNFEVDNNVIQGNSGSGIRFANNGQVDAQIANNRQGNQGITGNGGCGIEVSNAVSNVELVIDGNVINQNGFAVPNCPGVLFENTADVELQLINNVIDLNSFGGVRVANGSDFSDGEIRNNTFSNNGRGVSIPFGGGGGASPFGNGFTASPQGDVEDLIFEGNVAQGNFFRGVSIDVDEQDVSNLVFRNERYTNNGLGAPGGDVTAGLGIRARRGSVADIEIHSMTANQNGGSGVHMVAFDDLSGIRIFDSTFMFNGASAPVGSGDGVFLSGDKVKNVHSEANQSDFNDDHGFFINSRDDVDGVTFIRGSYDNNDRNNDTVGAGIEINSTNDMNDITVMEVSASGNGDGITLDIRGQNGNGILIDNNPSVNNNVNSGIKIDVSDDLSNTTITNNTVTGNGINLELNVNDRGQNILVSDNRFVGASGIGIQLNSTGTTISNNDIRNHTVGIDVTRARDNHINNNNIVNNQTGIDASAIVSGENLDAINNWWREPSGPQTFANPGGLGDRVSSKVDFVPFLSQPVGVTGANFQIFAFAVPASLAIGASATIRATVQNSGTEEATQQIVIRIKDDLGVIIVEEKQTVPLNPQASIEISITHAFGTAGMFTVEVVTDNDMLTKTLVVGEGGDSSGPGGASIAAALDGNANDRLDDDEIVAALKLWIQGQTVPGTNQKINDEEILRLIAMWISGAPIR